MIASLSAVILIHRNTHITLSSDSLSPHPDSHSLQNGGGSGFGLYIAKAVVVLHRGCIWAESEGIGKGSVFSVRLPLSKVRVREGTELYAEETD